MADTKKEIDKKDIQGIGGWLLIPTIEFFIALIVSGFFSISFLSEILTESFDTFYFGAVLYAFMTILFGYILTSEFQRKKKFKLWAVGALWAYPIVTFLLNIIVSNNLKETFLDYGLIILNAIIWTIYLNKSKRVKNTFVN